MQSCNFDGLKRKEILRVARRILVVTERFSDYQYLFGWLRVCWVVLVLKVYPFMWKSEIYVPCKHGILIAGLHKPATRWNQRRNVLCISTILYGLIYDLVGLAALRARVLRFPRPPQLRCSFHFLYNCLLARLMVKRDNPRNIPAWEEIPELVKSLSQWHRQTESIRLLLC